MPSSRIGSAAIIKPFQMEQHDKMASLIAALLTGSSQSPKDRQQLDEWLAADPRHQQIYADLQAEGNVTEAYVRLQQARTRNYEKVKARLTSATVPWWITIRPVMVAAVIAACIAVPIFAHVFGLRLDAPVATQTAARSQKDVAIVPAAPKAVLQLADGRTIELDSTTTGLLAYQGGTAVTAKGGAVIDYTHTDQTADVAATNIITTPKGGVFCVTLSDGSKVWLNAGSRLEYPTRFADTRQVRLQGEAYFEVAHQQGAPFRVSLVVAPGAAPVSIDVLGTHFNVRAYVQDRDIRATLIQGAVRFRHGDAQALLRPLQQARVAPGPEAKIEVLADVSVAEVMGWKDGYFNFESARADVVLAEVARWYDLTVEWQTVVPKDGLWASISRKAGIESTLKLLERSDVPLRFTLDGRVIRVKARP